jgi:hypothetical protein
MLLRIVSFQHKIYDSKFSWIYLLILFMCCIVVFPHTSCLYFGEICRLHFHGGRTRQAWNFDKQVARDIFLLNVNLLPKDYTALHHKNKTLRNFLCHNLKPFMMLKSFAYLPFDFLCKMSPRLQNVSNISYNIHIASFLISTPFALSLSDFPQPTTQQLLQKPVKILQTSQYATANC